MAMDFALALTNYNIVFILTNMSWPSFFLLFYLFIFLVAFEMKNKFSHSSVSVEFHMFYLATDFL